MVRMAGQMTRPVYDDGGAMLLGYSVMFTRKIVSPHDFHFPNPYSFFSLDAEKIQAGM